MDGYFFDTNAVSVLWNIRHPEHDTVKAFFTSVSQSPICLWFIARNKKNGKFRDRSGHSLFIDASKMGILIDRIHRDLSDEEIDRIAGTYHAWRGEKGTSKYEDMPGFCKSIV